MAEGEDEARTIALDTSPQITVPDLSNHGQDQPGASSDDTSVTMKMNGQLSADVSPPVEESPSDPGGKTLEEEKSDDTVGDENNDADEPTEKVAAGAGEGSEEDIDTEAAREKPSKDSWETNEKVGASEEVTEKPTTGDVSSPVEEETDEANNPPGLQPLAAASQEDEIEGEEGVGVERQKQEADVFLAQGEEDLPPKQDSEGPPEANEEDVPPESGSSSASDKTESDSTVVDGVPECIGEAAIEAEAQEETTENDKGQNAPQENGCPGATQELAEAKAVVHDKEDGGEDAGNAEVPEQKMDARDVGAERQGSSNADAVATAPQVEANPVDGGQDSLATQSPPDQQSEGAASATGSDPVEDDSAATANREVPESEKGGCPGESVVHDGHAVDPSTPVEQKHDDSAGEEEEQAEEEQEEAQVLSRTESMADSDCESGIARRDSLLQKELNEALVQIVSLTEERDMLKKKKGGSLKSKKSADKSDIASAASDVLMVELQSSLQDQMGQRAEAEEKVRQMEEKVQGYEERIKKYLNLEEGLDRLNATLVEVVEDKSKLENEISVMREAQDDAERKEVVLSNRLNEAKKKEAMKANLAERLENENEALRQRLAKTKADLDEMTKGKEKLEQSMEKLKKKCVDRVKLSENALADERNLNDERKKKMKVFVETKAEELRLAKAHNDELQTELEETRVSLRETQDKLERMHSEWTASQTRNRELQRDMNRLRKSSDQLHKIGDNLELELHKSAQETEEHKNKRLTAKHELMTILRTLEAERAVSGKLRDSIKFTFTPKALSQQQLLTESLVDFEGELLKLSRRLGKPLPAAQNQGEADENESDHSRTQASATGDDGDSSDVAATSSNGVARGGKKPPGRGTKSDWDSSRLLSNLESETQRVSQGIMSLTSQIERLRSLLDEGGDRNCVSLFTEMLAGTGNMNRIVGGEADPGGNGDDDSDERVSITAFANAGDSQGSFQNSPGGVRVTRKDYGRVG